MSVNVAVNVRDALQGLKIAKDIQCWLDSTVALHWLNDNGKYRQFVANRVNKMKSQENMLWRHVPTSDNPADLGSRGGSVTTAAMVERSTMVGRPKQMAASNRDKGK